MKNIKTLLLTIFFAFIIPANVALAESVKLPDLYILKIDLSDCFLGKPIQVVAAGMCIEMHVKNKGKVAAQDSALDLYIYKGKSKENLLPKEHQVPSYVKALEPGKRFQVGKYWQPFEPGIYTIKACVDEKNDVEEKNEKNNCKIRRVKVSEGVATDINSNLLLPDLIVEQIHTYNGEPTNPLANDRFSIGFGLAQYEGVSCPGSFRITLKAMDKDGKYHDGVSFNTDQNYAYPSFLNPLDGSCPKGFLSSDFYFKDLESSEIVSLEPYLDAQNQISESNEENNNLKFSGSYQDGAYWYKKS